MIRQNQLPTLPFLLVGIFLMQGCHSTDLLAVDPRDQVDWSGPKELSLMWLAKNQKKDGHWEASPDLKIPDRAGRSHPVTTTALSLIAMQGAGYTWDEGRYRPFIRYGLRWVFSQQRADGSFPGGTLPHASATLSASIHLSYTRKHRERAIRAARHLERLQLPGGGWAIRPGSDDVDMTVTALALLALRSSCNAGIRKNTETWDRATKFIQNRIDSLPVADSSAMELAQVLASAHMLGFQKDNDYFKKGAKKLVNVGPSLDKPNYEYLLLASLSTFCQDTASLEGEYWFPWNMRLRDPLVGKQIRTPGPLMGSYSPGTDRKRSGYGRAGVTALSNILLEIYYRYLPVLNSFGDYKAECTIGPGA